VEYFRYHLVKNQTQKQQSFSIHLRHPNLLVYHLQVRYRHLYILHLLHHLLLK
jgi:hypothetical protein